MSFGVSAALQKSVYQALIGSVDLSSAVGGAIFDAAPSGQIPELYVSLGPEIVRERSDIGVDGARHEFTVSVVASRGGFSSAKEIAVMVNDILSGANLVLERGSLIFLRFLKAVAKPETAEGRRIDMIFRARVDDI